MWILRLVINLKLDASAVCYQQTLREGDVSKDDLINYLEFSIAGLEELYLKHKPKINDRVDIAIAIGKHVAYNEILQLLLNVETR